MWEVEVLDWKTKGKTVRRAKILVSGVGALSVPKECDIPGAEVYKGRLFHSAKWDHGFDWGGKDVVVLGIFPPPPPPPSPYSIHTNPKAR